MKETIAGQIASLVFRGKVRTAVQFETQRGEVSVLKMDAINAKSKDAIINVLRKKFPAHVIPNIELLEQYNEIPEFSPSKSRRMLSSR